MSACNFFSNLDPTILQSIGINTVPSPSPATSITDSSTVSTGNGNDYTQVYPLVKKQNNSLQNTIKSKNEMYSTDNQQFIYKYDKYNSLVSANYFLFIVYMCIGCFLFIFLILSDKLSLIPKILIIICFALYPFVIFYVENYIYMNGLYVYSVISGESYWDMSAYSREKGLMY